MNKSKKIGLLSFGVLATIIAVCGVVTYTGYGYILKPTNWYYVFNNGIHPSPEQVSTENSPTQFGSTDDATDQTTGDAVSADQPSIAYPPTDTFTDRELMNFLASTNEINCDQKDQGYIANAKIDMRVAKLLVYLVNEKKHKQIAVRIKSGYDTEDQALSRETYYANPADRNISAHFTAQAVDVMRVDGTDFSWQEGNDPIEQKRAHDKIQEIVRDVFEYAHADQIMCPSQIILYSKDDITPFSADIKHFYPYPANWGMATNPRMVDRIHIGF